MASITLRFVSIVLLLFIVIFLFDFSNAAPRSGGINETSPNFLISSNGRHRHSKKNHSGNSHSNSRKKKFQTTTEQFAEEIAMYEQFLEKPSQLKSPLRNADDSATPGYDVPPVALQWTDLTDKPADVDVSQYPKRTLFDWSSLGTPDLTSTTPTPSVENEPDSGFGGGQLRTVRRQHSPPLEDSIGYKSNKLSVYNVNDKINKNNKEHGWKRNPGELEAADWALKAKLNILSMEGDTIRCATPKPRVMKVQDFYPDSTKRYLPSCVVLHRCDRHSGCCEDENAICSPARRQYVYRYFFVVPMGQSTGEVERLRFLNHTECECRKRKPPRYKVESQMTGCATCQAHLWLVLIILVVILLH